MDALEQLIINFASDNPMISLILTILGTLVVLVLVIIPLTPTKKDDEILEKVKNSAILMKILNFLIKFSKIDKK